jgi:uncharacterized membrane protein
MIDPELKHHLEKIEKELVELRVTTTSIKSSLVRGLVYGAGYVVGVVVVIVIVGWILNVVGIIPAFNDKVDAFRSALERVGGPIK